MEPLTDVERAYLAGFLDGDGCIHIAKAKASNSPVPYHRLSVLFSQADKEFLERWRDRVGMGRVHFVRGPGGSYGGVVATKALYNWVLTSGEAETMLHYLLPYLDIKKEQAEIAIKFRATKGRQGGDGRRRTSIAVLNLRESYRQKLKSAKRSDDEQGEFMSCESELESLYDSQLTLFTLDN